MKYYIKCNGKTFGPAEEEKIRQYVASGFFKNDSLVSTDLQNWLPLQNCIPVAKKNPITQLLNKNHPESDGSQEQKGLHTTETDDEQKEQKNISGTGRKGTGLPKAAIIAIGVFFVLLLAVAGSSLLFRLLPLSPLQLFKSSGTDSGDNFRQVCKKYQSAVGVVTVILEDSNGKLFSGTVGNFKVTPEQPIGTAFAIGKNKFATNCHVAYAVKEQKNGVLDKVLLNIVAEDARKQGVKTGSAFLRYWKQNAKSIEIFRSVLRKTVRVRNVEIRLAHSNGRSVAVSGVQIHPRYLADPDEKNVFKNGEFDVAIFSVSEDVSTYCTVASKKKLYSLSSGQKIAYIGFPMEGLYNNGNLDLNRPEAVIKQGTINKITDFNNVYSTPDVNKSIIHDIPASGGASGSPIFLPDGEVVAILWAVTHTGNNDQGRIASAVQHNMAVRIDSLDIVKKQRLYTMKEWLGEKNEK